MLGRIEVEKNLEFPRVQNIISEFFEKLKVSDYYRKSESIRLPCKQVSVQEAEDKKSTDKTKASEVTE